MILCPRYQWVYLGPPKTASSSLHHWLSQPAFCATRWSPVGRTDQHAMQIPQEAAGWFVFASIRNPYARAVSLWRHSQAGGRRDGGLPAMSFEEFLDWVRHATPFYRLGQADWLAEVRLDAVVRVEALARDLRRLPWVDRLDPTIELEDIPHLNRTSHRPWPSYFPTAAPGELPGGLAEIVRRLWAEDFDRFAYRP